jgi:pyruvate formate lyase activating enzyme
VKAPLIVEIKDNSLDDGPGIRSVVFFKGCPLSCRWCHNPESQNLGHEIAFDASECIGCDTCLETCQEAALSRDNPFYIDRSKCNLCFACVDTCPSGALSRVGKTMTLDAILQATLKNKSFFNNSSGGVTLSGGEPTMFSAFTSDLLKVFKNAGIHTLMETCGMFELTAFEEMLSPFIDLLYFDIKLINAEEHNYFCGLPNDRILANFRHLQKKYIQGPIEIIPRTPLIPGITDTEQNLSGIADFLKECNVDTIQLLSYHPLWQVKNLLIGRENPPGCNRAMKHFMSAEQQNACRGIFEAKGIRVQQ